MMRNVVLATLLSAGVAMPAQAQDAEPVKPLTIVGSASLVSDYRFRGISLSDEDPALQVSLGLEHESGLYAGTWASNLNGYGSVDGADVEIDLYGGYRTNLGSAEVDVGLIWYFYPGTDETDYAEIYGSVGTEIGPLSAKLGLSYAPDRRAIGSEDNWYIYTDVNAGIPNTPITLKTHLGYSVGDSVLAPTGEYFDWLIGVDVTYKTLTFGVAYVDTDIKDQSAFFSIGDKDILDAAVVVSATVAF